MKYRIGILKVFGYLWLTLAVIIIIIGTAGVWMKDGFSGVQQLLSPFNLTNWVLTVIVLAPGFGAIALANKFKLKSSASKFDEYSKTTDTKINYLEGEVNIVNYDNKVTQFRLIENGAVVSVRNDIHIRLTDNPYPPPEKFTIVAPMTATSVIEGEIPNSYIKHYTLEYYLSLRKQYHGE